MEGARAYVLRAVFARDPESASITVGPSLKDTVRLVAFSLLDLQTAIDEQTARSMVVDPNAGDLTAAETAAPGLAHALGDGFSLDEPTTDEGRAVAAILAASGALMSQLLSRLAEGDESLRELVTAELREWVDRSL